MVIWPGSCSQQDPLVTQSPYTGTPEEGLRQVPGQDSHLGARGGRVGAQG